MNLIELHILQSFPVSCLNRDDVGSPKSALFGGVQRARISSQAIKRAIRLDFNESHYGSAFHTERTKLAHENLAKILNNDLKDEKLSSRLALEALSRLVDKGGASKAKADKRGRMNMPALIWLSPAQIQSAADAVLKNKDLILEASALDAEAGKDKNKLKEAGKKLNDALKPVSKAIQDAGISDAADIAMFGRMVANDPSLNVESAAMFSHPLSTHSVANEVDFYTAVDDVKNQRGETDESESDDAGAGMMGTLEFNSATYYRYVGINVGMIFDKDHLGPITDQEERKKVLRAFLTACLTAVPGARKNSMNAATLPFEVLGIRKSKGQPLQLINAFEEPVKTNGKGLQATSLAAMKSHLDSLEKTWGPSGEKFWLTELGLDVFLDQLLQADV